MDITKYASSGTLESSDAYVEIEPSENGIKIELESVVYKQFGENIKKVAGEVLSDMNVKNATLRITDKGALECVIRARIETAVLRGGGN